MFYWIILKGEEVNFYSLIKQTYIIVQQNVVEEREENK